MATPPERREVQYQSLEEVVADVEQLAAGEVTTIGQHSFAAIVEHLARAHDTSTGKLIPPKPPLLMRLIMPFIKGKIINGKEGIKPGVKLPPAAESYFWPSEVPTLTDAIQHLQESVDRFQTSGPLAVHPVFGKLTADESLRLQLRHAALHLSFVYPKVA